MQSACVALIPLRVQDQGSRHDLNCHPGMSFKLPCTIAYHVIYHTYVMWLPDHAWSQPIGSSREENRYCWCQSCHVLFQPFGQFRSNTLCWHDVHWRSCMLWQDQRRGFPQGLMHCHMCFKVALIRINQLSGNPSLRNQDSQEEHLLVIWRYWKQARAAPNRQDACCSWVLPSWQHW